MASQEINANKHSRVLPVTPAGEAFAAATEATLAAIAGGVGVIDLSATDKSYTHTTAGTAEEVTGLTAGDVYVVDGTTAAISVGATKLIAEGSAKVNRALPVRVPAGATSFWIDCSNSTTPVSVLKVG